MNTVSTNINWRAAQCATYTVPMLEELHTSIDRSLVWFAAVTAALPCFYLSWVLFNVWRDPMAWDEGSWVRLGVGLLILEFVLLHSGAFIVGMLELKGQIRDQLKIAAGLLVFYSLMVWGFSKSLDEPALIWIFAGITLGRSLNLLRNPAESKQAIIARSVIGVILYMLVVAGTIFLSIPELGITNAVLNEVYPGRGTGLWEAQPERAIAGAALYFLLIGLAEITVLRANGAKSSE